MVEKAAPVLNLSKYIETRFFGNRPHIRGRRVPVATVVSAAHANAYNVADLMAAYTLSEPEVLAALLYYAENKSEIDLLEAEYEAVPIEDWIKHGENALLLRRNDATSSGE